MGMKISLKHLMLVVCLAIAVIGVLYMAKPFIAGASIETVIGFRFPEPPPGGLT